MYVKMLNFIFHS